MKRSEVDLSKVSPMMKDYLRIKKENEDAILFFRIGDFYEMFFEDALICVRELDLVLTGKSAGLDDRVPMCGVPVKAYTEYLKKMVDKGYKVAICEQLEDPKEAKGTLKRGVVQVVSPGTIIDEYLDSSKPNYVCGLYNFKDEIVITYTDISIGYFYVLKEKEENVLSILLKEEVKEVVATSKINKILINNLRLNNILVTVNDDIITPATYSYLYENLNDERLKLGVKHLLNYINELKKGSLKHLQEVIEVKEDYYLEFDNNTVRNLELLKTLKTGDSKNSLFHFLNHTKTAMGSRLLEYNIIHPLKNKKEIENRYDIIEKFLCEFVLAEELSNALKEIYDLERLSSRINYGNLSGKDLLQLKKSLNVLPIYNKLLEALKLDYKVNELKDLTSILNNSIKDDISYNINDGNLIKTGYNEELDKLRSIKRDARKLILEVEIKEKEKLGINLKVSYNKVFGYYIEITKNALKGLKLDNTYIRKQTLSNSERFITEELKTLEDDILNADYKINNLEIELFNEVKEEVKSSLKEIQEISKNIAFIDMMLSLSSVARKHSYIRPNLNEEFIIDIKDARHPVLETLEEDYVYNNVNMNENTKTLIITGPNMSGKSTYMRMTALIVIMAQIGSYVPASFCNLMIFDKLFTRIGASDDLVGGASTFMVEMKEASLAVKKATNKSLILFDELGRGTATYDGMAIAEAILEYINDEIEAKTLFSTHYHELTSLDKDHKGIKNVHVKAEVKDNILTFLHKVESGPADKSYGIHVARLAGLPEEVNKKAESILNIYEKSNSDSFYQLSFNFEEPKKKTYDLKELKLDEMTPIEALNLLYKMKDDK